MTKAAVAKTKRWNDIETLDQTNACLLAKVYLSLLNVKDCRVLVNKVERDGKKYEKKKEFNFETFIKFFFVLLSLTIYCTVSN